MAKTNRSLPCLFLCTFLAAQSKPQSARIGESAVWQMPGQFMTTAHSACDQSTSPYGECMIAQMKKAGAAPDAVRFSEQLYAETHGEFAVMTGFQQEGPVDFAWISYPLRANTNYGLLLVNGQPRILNVEDLKLLDIKGMKSSSQFQNLKARFPEVGLWPGDPDGKTWPDSAPGPNGGIQFRVGYPLINGCHACARAGSAVFNWNFDAKGKFLGTTFQELIDPPFQ